MDIQQLKCLLAVLYTKSFSEAGELMHISQSAISKKIMSLERELGVPLIERSKKNIVLTSFGDRLMSDFVSIIESYDNAMLELEGINEELGSVKQRLKIAGVPPMYRYGIIAMTVEFSRQHPEINLTLDEMESDRAFLTIQSDNYDIAFCPNVKLNPKYYGTQFVANETFMLAMSSENPLSEKKTVRMQDLKNSRLILHKENSSLYKLCEEACLNAGFAPNVVTTTSRPNIAFQYVHSSPDIVYMGFGRTLLGEPATRHRIVRIENAPTIEFAFAWKKSNPLSPAAQTFLKFATDFKCDITTSPD